MQVAVRPRMKAGIAVVGASALAIAPIAVAPPDSKLSAASISSAAVALTANPVDFYTEVFERSLGNTQALAEIFLSNPVPVLQQVLANQFANIESLVAAVGTAANGIATALTDEVPQLLQTAFNDLSNGNVEGALNTLLSLPLTFALPLLEVVGAIVVPITTAVNNFNAVVQDVLVGAILGGALAIAGPVLSGIGSVGTAVQGVIDAVGSGDLGEVVSALVNTPAVIADGVLNGGYGPLLLGILPAPGVLTPEGLLGALGAGPIGFLLGIRQAIADAIAPQDMTLLRTESDTSTDEGITANSLPNDDANFVNVNISGDGGTGSTGASDEESEEGAEGGEGSEGAEGGQTGGLEEENDGDDGDLEKETEEKTKAGGGTDLSDGNKVEPGQVNVGEGTTGAGDGTGEETEPTETTPTVNTGGDAGDGDTGGGDGGGDGGGTE
ncbi:hypothetical protein SAMN04489835_2907 [Mycolicibacterium rutilum]|uniref:PE-PGRS family protein n=1 Tax=Mycolicibacterium rutilum TaxID=370526 RepID=A0A1H6KBY0_MYCRU|nr:hypothetical protein [Mycolicibacterium rutilum]SEH68982.1 hypothetical protein SAMN04489835_2907 [Mycolicibacterium rutilum]